ncbi:MAG: 16S rRNA (guanine(966)-N(2))-methyltransferase RsmD [Calditrichia bacterium]|nr:16S rRNA (guanine(966)-N(2))-methyltransferase RsmD [Calditrichota bacterium]MCB0268937.1 16S rRNA (guanine(966)-N(2))-methyltransferase RsmD [Calditrichota bacterium]MCB0287451.1 16S rRNA (guanine(966)-N(2))-methyltransferase RsmD [Calditrichota bacterium]MCB9070466.1 16S rRNA (guanine(966)-N(2))-methyltransferase RsmD [Calditrichia bacterium]
MRIISGKYKGRQLQSAKDQSIRPTTNKIKEYIFELIGGFVNESVALDLFCGSGSLGLESLSRGASNVTFVDSAQSSLRVLRRNIGILKVEEPFKILRKDSLMFLKSNRQPFDLVFADPPYQWADFDRLFSMMFKKTNLSETGLFVLECEKTVELPVNSDKWELLRQKHFDRTVISFFSRKGIVE